MNYQLFGQTGLNVSQIALGTGNFGTGWGYGSSPEEAKLILDAYLNAGGNFIDTADVYQFGQSEQILGDLLQGIRNEVILYSCAYGIWSCCLSRPTSTQTLQSVRECAWGLVLYFT